MHYTHLPVLLQETVAELKIRPDGTYVDCTTGEGGHAEAIAAKMSEQGMLVLIDRDQRALEIAASRVTRARGPVIVTQETTFDNLLHIRELTGQKVSGVLFDFGISSFQLNDPGRGMSYRHDGPLDMRMDQSKGQTAADLVNELPAAELARIIFEYGEERFAHRIADFIVVARDKRAITSTSELADIIKNAIPARARRTGPHPARRTFQALRIAVNDELAIIGRALTAAIELLELRGRIVTIAYHSLEDRIVKQTFARYSECQCPPGLPVCRCKNKVLTVLQRRPIYPTQDEIAGNPRARSARLRSAERSVLAELEDE